MSEQQIKKTPRAVRGGTAWPLILGWLASFLLVVLAALLVVGTTLCSAGYMKGKVRSSDYATVAYAVMYEDFSSYGAATGFSAETMASVLDINQIESDMEDAVDGLYAADPYHYDRTAIREEAYAAMQAEAEANGITLEGDTAEAVTVVAEAVRQVYASHTSIPMISQLHNLIERIDSILWIGVVLCAAFAAAALILMLRLARSRPRFAVRGLVFAFGGAGLVCLVLALGVNPLLGLQRLSLEPASIKQLVIAYLTGMFGRFGVFAAIYLLLAVLLALPFLLKKKRKSA